MGVARTPTCTDLLSCPIQNCGTYVPVQWWLLLLYCSEDYWIHGLTLLEINALVTSEFCHCKREIRQKRSFVMNFVSSWKSCRVSSIVTNSLKTSQNIIFFCDGKTFITEAHFVYVTRQKTLQKYRIHVFQSTLAADMAPSMLVGDLVLSAHVTIPDFAKCLLLVCPRVLDWFGHMSVCHVTTCPFLVMTRIGPLFLHVSISGSPTCHFLVSHRVLSSFCHVFVHCLSTCPLLARHM